ncbi:Putative restriction endonuclease [Jatrophihabitans endophyticus]|uniref:Putative restriction endonuclease n=1 Tax=Jatrophihabitans endophyticus TaxID=1206085 RepID=A0A1M5GDR2_9ACTN|nr:Uma2 family endonuclease [Jatrophihabitans endophyticus]SHG01877.1 Putative restriction endonuclease [Jatrophihabitans endophyticus]
MSAVFDLIERREWTPETLHALLAEPRDHDLDWRRFEIVDGVLLVSPQSTPRHELVVAKLIVALGAAVPAGHRAIGAVGIGIGRSYRVTDVTVVADRVFGRHDATTQPGDVLLAVEVESPSSVTTDRITKPAQYAAAGIPHFWRIETSPLVLHAYRLVDGVYAPAGSWRAGETARVTEPFAVDLDVAGLLPA